MPFQQSYSIYSSPDVPEGMVPIYEIKVHVDTEVTSFLEVNAHAISSPYADVPVYTSSDYIKSRDNNYTRLSKNVYSNPNS